jgi:hypothetical protein
VGLYTLNSVYPWLESAWFQPLNLKCDFLVLRLCFQIQVVPLRSGIGNGQGNGQGNGHGDGNGDGSGGGAAVGISVGVGEVGVHGLEEDEGDLLDTERTSHYRLKGDDTVGLYKLTPDDP